MLRSAGGAPFKERRVVFHTLFKRSLVRTTIAAGVRLAWFVFEG